MSVPQQVDYVMTEAARILNLTFRRVLLTQMFLVVATAAGVSLWLPQTHGRAALAALYGGGISLLAAWRLARSLNAATPGADIQAARASLRLYAGAAERFLVSGLLLALGIAAFRLPPLALIAGFGIAQLGFFGGISGAGP